MTKKYIEIPSNFNYIKDFIIYEKDRIIKAFFKGEKYFFYDTCSFIHHSNSKRRNLIIKYFKENKATLIITRTVLMELLGTSNTLHMIQLEYIKELYNENQNLILINEEMIGDLLKEMLALKNDGMNQLLGYAIREICKFKTITYDIMKKMNKMNKSFYLKIIGDESNSELLYEKTFKYIRSQKSEGDSLAEELILICIIILTKMPIGKYILISDDLRIRSNVISVNDYILRHHNVKEPFQLTTTSLVYRMFMKGILKTSDDMMEILQCVSDGNIKSYYIGEYDIKIEFESFDKNKLIDRLMNEKDFRIIY